MLRRALHAVKDLRGRLDAIERAGNEPIAVVGIGCRFPGGVHGPDAFWELLKNGVDAITEVPPDRWDVKAYYDPDPAAPGKIYTRHGGFVDDVQRFDAHFFGISPREAVSIDPQQRLLLEVTWEALEHAGVSPAALAGSRTGVFVGVSTADYARMMDERGLEFIDPYGGTGGAPCVAAGRISYVLGLHGPTLAIDTACSSSLVATYLACASLRQRQCEVALAGGVNLMLAAHSTVHMAKVRALSPDGRCRTFDARAAGYGRGEGCGILVLKRLSDAEAAGDRIMAVIRGAAINHDGRKSGLTVPNGAAQQECVREALAAAGVEPAAVSYVEAHGTGTPLGDPIEVRALSAVLGPGRPADRPLLIGSVKTNIGHLEAAAGVSALIKVVLSLQHGDIPPHLHLTEPTSHIEWNDLPIEVPTRLRAWPPGPKIAGVSGFGFSGTNAHLILEAAAPPSPPVAGDVERSHHLLVLSAQTERSLAELARLYDTRLTSEAETDLADVCFSANTTRSHFAHRVAIVAASKAEARDKLKALADRAAAGTMAPRTRPRIAFLFTGQGSQYVGMGRELYETQPTFRRVLDRCDALLRPEMDRSLLSLLYPEQGATSPIDETGYTQPALFALEYALAELLRSWGVVPGAVLGHSVGEYAAACVAGVVGLEDALHLIAARARLMQALPQDGAMAAVFASEAAVSAALQARPALAIAAVNGPEHVVISGERGAVEATLATLRDQGVRSQPLTVSHAFHSPLMEPMLGDFEGIAAAVSYSHPRLGFVSNLTGQFCKMTETPDAGYWRSHVREPVRFADGMRALSEKGYDVFVEIGPQPTLLGMGRRCLPEGDQLWLPTLRKGRSDWAEMLAAVAALYVRGGEIDWPGFDRDYPRRRVSLPTYPFDRQRYWISPVEPTALRRPSPSQRPTSGHPLLGPRLSSPLEVIQFEAEIGAQSTAFLADHALADLVVFPAAGYVEMALAAASDVFGAANPVLEGIEFQHALVLPDQGVLKVQLLFSPTEDGSAEFRILSLSSGDQAEATWRLHVTGRARRSGPADAADIFSLAEAKARCDREVDVGSFYASLREGGGVSYGSAFQAVERFWAGAGEAVGRLRLPEAIVADAGGYHLHPVLLDAGFQLLGAAVVSGPAIPTGLARARVLHQVPNELWGHVAVVQDGARLRADVRLFDDSGSLVAEVEALEMRPVSREALERLGSDRAKDWLYEVAWKPAAVLAETPIPGEALGDWLIVADPDGVGAALASRIEQGGGRSVLVVAGDRYDVDVDGRYRVDATSRGDFERVLKEALHGRPAWRGVVHLGGDDEPEVLSPTALGAAQRRACGSLLSLVQALAAYGGPAPRLWVVTRGGQQVGEELDPRALSQAPTWGLAGTVALEHPQLRCVRVDLDADPTSGVEALWREIGGDGVEDQIAYRRGERRVARLVRSRDARAGGSGGLQLPPGQSFRLMVPTRGVLDNLRLEPIARREPGPGEVEIRVRATGLNFRDVLNVLGMYPGDPGPLGGECAGTVIAVGPGVDGLAVGDAVVALMGGSFSSHLTVPAVLVVKKPARLTFEEAATIPIAFLTADFGLVRLAAMKRGDRVLIHAGAGGVGLAAIQLAQRAGAEVFATAGNDEKRSFLSSLGVPHVMDSRSLDFVQEIRKRTGGEGVDVVLNSLSGDFIAASLSVLGAGGRFVEIGKRDIWDPARLRQARPDASYWIFDLGEAIVSRPADVRAGLTALMDAVAAETLQPLPRRTFSIHDAVQAFRFMAQARHIGKVVVTQPDGVEIGGHATYLVTGGLGALGLRVARWMVEQGARHLALLGRRAPSARAREEISAMEQAGAAVRVIAADVEQPAQVTAAIDEMARAMPPLRGVVHAAGQLDDGVLTEQHWRRFAKVFGPKVDGAWNLHASTHDLDFFVLFSSSASVLGSPGQGNYAAANAFLDALAKYRRARGLPAVTINWGPWAEIGMAAAMTDPLQRRRHVQGVGAIPPAQGLRVLGELLRLSTAQTIVLPIDWDVFSRQFADRGVPPFLSDVVRRAAGDDTGGSPLRVRVKLRPRLTEAAPKERQEILLAYVREQALRVLGVPEDSSFDARRPLPEYGLDSLMAVELRNALTAAAEIPLPTSLILDYPTVEALAQYLGDAIPLTPGEIDEAADVQGGDMMPALSVDGQTAAALLTRLDSFSDNEVDALLSRILAESPRSETGDRGGGAKLPKRDA